MLDNPYAAPAPILDELPKEKLDRVQRMIRPPSLALLLLAGLMAALSAAYVISTGGLVIYLMTTGYAGSQTISMALLLMAGVIVLSIYNALIFFGALKMRSLGSRRWALAAAWMSVVPFLSPFMYLGMPFGVWALIVLRRPDVKIAFDVNRDIR